MKHDIINAITFPKLDIPTIEEYRHLMESRRLELETKFNRNFLVKKHTTFCGTYVLVDGGIYYNSKDYDEKFFSLHEELNSEEIKITLPHVLCMCGEDSFILQYLGGYNLDAKCISCGLTESVYSG